MRWILFKVISFLTVFIFMQGAILPWVISNNFFPLWADMILLTIILLMWLAVIDRLAFHVIKFCSRRDEIVE